MSAPGEHGRDTVRPTILGSMAGGREREGDARSHAGAMPRAYRDSDGQSDPDTATTFALEVDGEEFAVRLMTDPATGYTDTGYTWLSGPNQGYGFGVGGPPNPSPE